MDRRRPEKNKEINIVIIIQQMALIKEIREFAKVKQNKVFLKNAAIKRYGTSE